MSYTLTDYQQEAKTGVYQAYRDGARVVGIELPTGAGKTVVMGSVAHEYDGHGVSIAHRGILVGQMSLALAREGVRHDIIAPDSLIKTINAIHMQELGKSYYSSRAPWKVASVDTIIRRDLPASWVKMVGMVHIDEGHHVLRDNKWGQAFAAFPNAYGLLPSAFFGRADRKGLGRASDGIIDTLVRGPGQRWMIDNGHLTDYIIHGIKPDDLDLDDIAITDTGDFNQEQTRKRIKASTKIVGDIVKMYLEFARGLKGITFVVDVEEAHKVAKAYCDAGVPAVVVTAETPEAERRQIMLRFSMGDLMQLVNVDLFGEGMDVPAVQVVSMARPTASYSLFLQQFGRMLRLLVLKELRARWHTLTSAQRLMYIAESQKPRGILIDHVNNVIRHDGPPDWGVHQSSLDPGQRRSSGAKDAIPLRACANPTCLQPFLRMFPSCPHCGWTPAPPAEVTRPEQVDGDLTLYTQEMLRELINKKRKIEGKPLIPYDVAKGTPAYYGILNRHKAAQESQNKLRFAMGMVLPESMDQRVAARRFFHQYGVDTLTAQGLGSAEADELCQRILTKVRAVQ